MSETYDDLAERAERGQLRPVPGTARGGDAAGHAEVAQLLMDATGAPTLREAVHLAAGRPPVGTKRGPSPVVRARVPQDLKDRVRALAQREQRDESDIVREAVAAYIGMSSAS